MIKIEHREKSVAAPPRAEMDQFADWFDELRAAGWDTQIEIDADSGALINLAESAVSAYRDRLTKVL